MENEIENLIEKGESERIEFKSSLSEWKDAIRSLAAFSWSKGGRIVFGISRTGKVNGVEIGKGTIESLANSIKQNTDPKLYPSIKVFKIEDKNVISVETEKVSDEPVLAFGRAYKRIGKSTHQMSREEYKRIILEKHKEELRFDNKVCKSASLEDIDKEKVKWFLRKAKTERGLKIEENVSIKEALIKLKLMKEDKLTNAAILLFGKESEKFFLQNEVKCILFKGNEPVKPYIDFKTLTGDVIDIIDKAEDFVLRNIKKAIWIEPGKIERQERYEYPEEAIREAIVNAVVHRDYTSPSKVQVRIFDSYIEIWNPGKLPEGWTVEKLKKKHESVPKNPLLFKQLFWIKYVEDVGGGTIDMVNKCKEWGLPEPEFEFTGTSLVSTFYRSKYLDNKYLTELGLNQRQKEVVKYAIKNKRITNKEFRQLFPEISDESARLYFINLVNRDVFKKYGEKKGVYYILVYPKNIPNIPKDYAKITQRLEEKPIAREELLKLGLNERQIKAIEYVKKEGNITNKNYTEITNISRKMATLDLTDLVNKKIFKRIGGGKRNIKYVLSNDYAKITQKNK